MKHLAFRTYLIAFVFIAAISFPLINHYTGMVFDIKSFENRAMAKQPPVDINHLDPFPVKYDTFYNDNFNLRNRLIRYFNIYNVQAFRKSPVKSVIIGANNWLYLTGEEMDSYMGKNRLTAQQLEAYRFELEYRKKYLEERGIKFYFLIIPCKASIHSENIGYEYYRIHKDTWGEQLNAYLSKHSTVKIIDVFDSLRSHKKDAALFARLDNHWNDLGAFHTANQVFQVLHKDFPLIEPLSLNNYKIVHTKTGAANLDKMLGNLGVFSEDHFRLLPKNAPLARDGEKAGYAPDPGFPYPWDYENVKEIKGSKKPKALLISDSFGAAIFPFMAENFSKTVKIFDAWRYDLNEAITEQEKPDLMIVMIDEAVLKNILIFSDHHVKK